jgi:thiol:disulfide interchange protein
MKMGLRGWALFALSAIPTLLLLRWLLSTTAHEPFCERIYCWESGFHFLLGPIGLLLFIAYRLIFLGDGNRRVAQNSDATAIVYGVAFGMVALFLLSMTIHRSGGVEWDFQIDDPLHLSRVIESDRSGGPYLLFFHADWCSSCGDFERFVIGSPCAQGPLHAYTLFRIDATDFEKWHGVIEAHTGDSAVPVASILDRAKRRVPVSFTGDHTSVRAFCSVLKSVAEGAKAQPEDRR